MLSAGAAAPGSAKRPHVTIRGLSKRFDATVIYDKFDLDIPRGELISVKPSVFQRSQIELDGEAGKWKQQMLCRFTTRSPTPLTPSCFPLR